MSTDGKEGASREDAAASAESASGSDRRSEPRRPIELRVEYKQLNTFFADYTKNICKGGTFIRSHRPLPLGTEFVFQLVVPGMPEPLHLRGQVRWVKKEGEASPEDEDEEHREPGMGIRFVYASDEERARVEHAVDQLMLENLGPLVHSKLLGKDKA